MEISLKNRLALVTGGSGAIGSYICAYLYRAGARVVGSCHALDTPNAREMIKVCKEQGVHVEMAPFDVGDAESAEGAVRHIERTWGPVDILVNCAGITRDAPLRKMSLDQWRQVLHVNLDSVYNTTRPVIEGMLARGWGRIVNISSINGQKGQFGQTNYSAAKAGMHGFTMALAQEVARKGVTVNTVSPGYIDSPMIRAVPENIRNKILEGIPAGRFGEPRDIAAAVTFLCSEQAGFVNGANLAVNGAQFTCA
ncbi:MAG TPA: acetoacetyl-CoA reductase [Nevskia sp.]|nr:acetoacetyl-CoA reductase [Nevskia sp.]